MANIFGTNANLLVALAALLKERSVTAAAERMGVTQSAMSGTLAQLREVFGDPLLVRVGRSMQPTPRALALLEPLERGVAAFEDVLAKPARFEPATSEARFALALDDRAELLIVPHLFSGTRQQAPNVSMQVHAWGRLRLPPGLANGEIDLAIGVFFADSNPAASPRVGRVWPSANVERLPPGHHVEPLFQLGLATLARPDHPQVGRTLDLDAFCAVDHILVTQEPWATGVIDDALARKRRKRRIAARVPRFVGVGKLVATTDLVATIDDRIAHMEAATHGLRVLDPPVRVGTASLVMVWHERTDRDPAHRWIRAQVHAAGTSCGEASLPPRQRRGRATATTKPRVGPKR